MAAHAHEVAPVRCFIATVSDTRTEATDGSGSLARELARAHGAAIAGYRIVPDEPARIAALLDELGGAKNVDAIILTGGTGVARRDGTFEVVDARLEKRLDGFGELFRALSYPEIGPRAMLSRATAGTIGGVVVFSLPGSPHAVRLALERLILPVLGHIVAELRK